MISPEVAAFLRAQPRELPYSALVAACVARFGRDAAPDAEAVRRWWLSEAAVAGARTKIEQDAEVAAVIADLIGRLRPPEIMEALRRRFPAGRVPSRSALYRHVSALRHAAIFGDKPGRQNGA